MVLSSLASIRTINVLNETAVTMNMLSAVSLSQILGKVDHRGLAAVPLFDCYVSGVSGTVWKFNNIGQGYVSTNSAASLSFGVRVDIGGVIYYIPVYLAVA